VEGILRRITVVVLSHDFKASCEPVPQFLAPRDPIRGCEAFVDKIENGEQEQWFMRAFMLRTFRDRSQADVEIIKALNGMGDGCHSRILVIMWEGDNLKESGYS
jgi:hypothetical protein